MVRKVVLVIFFLLFTSACGGEAGDVSLPTNTPVPPTRTPAPTPTPRVQLPTSTPRPTIETATPPPPTSTPLPEILPDLSGVTLYEVTHLMDPRLFQVSMDGWPSNMPEETIVRVGMEFYTCDILFPDLFPERVYCWGKAPPKGTEVKIQVILEDVPQPLLEIPFQVPYPSDEGS